MVGELCHHTPSLIAGYFNNKQVTDEIIEVDEQENRWIHTGYLGFVDEDGSTFIMGHIKQIYTTFGSDGSMYRLFPQRIEEFVSTMPEVAYCSVVVIEDKEKSHVAIAYVELSDKNCRENGATSNLMSRIKSESPDKSIRVIDSMSLTESGKIDY